MTLPRLGFAGIGRMGAPMVGRLLDAGYAVSVFDTNADAVAGLVAKGATAAASLASLEADIVLLSLPTPEIVETVALGTGGLSSIDGKLIVIDLSTTGPRVSRTVAAGLAESGKAFVDCPVSGGVAGAEKGSLALMVACPADLYEEVRPILEVIGRPKLIGDKPGMGQMIKVINNLMSVTSLTIAAEALVLGAKAGLDPEVMLSVINSGSGASNATLDKVPKYIIGRNFDFGFAIGLSAKDARLCLEESEALGVPMVVGSAVRQMINITKGRFGADADLTEIIKPIEEWAGVTVSEERPRG
ncbi:NAD(P)-dependent oxidoreductase [Ensifer soli]|uniref:NAD(P)-dependent oxidoreductase n=1 Tax=Ciceribacter sp. sgz301302 TaxID=3342379 RepID=UPI0035B87A5F